MANLTTTLYSNNKKTDAYGYMSYITLEETEVNTANNTSKINFQIKISSTSGYYRFSQYTIGYKIVDSNLGTLSQRTTSNSQQYSIATAGDTITIANGSFTVAHNNDGSRELDLEVSLLFTAGTSGNTTPRDASRSISGTFALTTIQRYTKATISMVSSSYNIGAIPKIKITPGNLNSSLKYNITFSCNTTWSDNINSASGSTYTSYGTKVIPFDAIKGKTTTQTCTVTLTTYNGSTSLGSSSTSFTIPIPAKSTINSVSGLWFDKDTTLNFTKNNSYYTYKIKIGTSVIVNRSADTTSANAISETFKISSNTYCTDAQSKSITLILETYSGNTSLGTSTITKTFKIDNSNSTYNPSISSATIDYSFVSSNNNKYYFRKGKDSITITANGSTVDGATWKTLTSPEGISNVNISNTSSSKSCTFNFTPTSNIITNTAKKKNIKIKDSRELEGTKEITLNTIYLSTGNYIKHNISGVSIGKRDGNNNVEISFTLKGTDFGENTPDPSITFSEDTVQPTEPKIGKNTYVITVPLDQSKSFTITSTYLGETVSYTGTVPPEERAININFNRKGIAIGSFFPTELASSKWKLYINGDLYYNGKKVIVDANNFLKLES